MALNTSGQEPDIQARFGIAQDAPVPDDIKERQLAQVRLRAKIYDAAKFIASEVEPGREQSLAMTKLEEALLWAGKAIFA